MWCLLNDTDALAQLLEKQWFAAPPGRQVAERNALMRALQRLATRPGVNWLTPDTWFMRRRR